MVACVVLRPFPFVSFFPPPLLSSPLLPSLTNERNEPPLAGVCDMISYIPNDRNMDWRHGSRRGRAEQATDLPGPLFTLFCQLEAYCDAVLAGKSLLMLLTFMFLCFC